MSQATVNLVKKTMEEVFNKGNANAVSEFFDDKLKDLVRAGIRERKAAFPNLKYNIESIVDEGDVVAFRYTAEATHNGKFRNVEPTKKQLRWDGTVTVTVKQGKVVDIDVNENTASLMIQMGQLPKLKERWRPNATGVWTSSQSGVIVTLELKQSGDAISGTVAVSGVPGSSKVAGSLAGKRVTLDGAIAAAKFKFVGNFTHPNTISGELTGAVKASATLVRG